MFSVLFYIILSLTLTVLNICFPDLILEYEEGELYNNFKDFYDDIVPEFKAAGHVVQVKICCNYEPHLRGNVYIQYDRYVNTISGGSRVFCWLCSPILLELFF